MLSQPPSHYLGPTGKVHKHAILCELSCVSLCGDGGWYQLVTYAWGLQSDVLKEVNERVTFFRDLIYSFAAGTEHLLSVCFVDSFHYFSIVLHLYYKYRLWVSGGGGSAD